MRVLVLGHTETACTTWTLVVLVVWTLWTTKSKATTASLVMASLATIQSWSMARHFHHGYWSELLLFLLLLRLFCLHATFLVQFTVDEQFTTFWCDLVLRLVCIIFGVIWCWRMVRHIFVQTVFISWNDLAILKPWSIWTFLPLSESPCQTEQKRYVHLLIAIFLEELWGN